MNISVIIPCYNVASYVEETLESVVNATRHFDGRLECICVDDGSTDGTGEKIDAFMAKAATQANLIYKVIHQANAGSGAARNAGLAVATGEWVMFLDGDDLWLEDILSTMEKATIEHSKADIISFQLTWFEGDAQGVNKVDVSERNCRVFDTRKFIADELVIELGICPTLFRRATFKDEKYEKLSLGQDRLYVSRCLAKADQVVRDSKCLLAYRQREGSSTHVAWSVRKILSQCDYAVGALRYLAHSGKEVECGGVRYLAQRWLSEVPNRILRIKDKSERMRAWEHWIQTIEENDFSILSSRQMRIRHHILAWKGSMIGSLYVARIFRKLGII